MVSDDSIVLQLFLFTRRCWRICTFFVFPVLFLIDLKAGLRFRFLAPRARPVLMVKNIPIIPPSCVLGRDFSNVATPSLVRDFVNVSQLPPSVPFGFLLLPCVSCLTLSARIVNFVLVYSATTMTPHRQMNEHYCSREMRSVLAGVVR